MAKLQTKEQARETEQGTAPQEIPAGEALSREEPGQIHETEAKEAAQLPEGTENLPAATQGDGLVEVSDGEYNDWLEEDDDEGGSTPILFISQKEKQGTVGSLVCRDMDEEYESMRVVLLRVQPGCIMWPEKFSSDSEPLCKSDDGINPVRTEELTPFCDEPDACLGKWRKVDGKNVKAKPCVYGNWDNGAKPRCEEVIKLLVVEVGLGSNIPYWITLKGFSKSEFSKLNRSLAMKVKALKGRMARQGKRGAKKCLFSFEMATQRKEYDAGDHYIISFSDIEEVDDELKSEMLGFSFQAREMSLATQHETVDDTSEGADDQE